ncbi:MAG: hybrid sensor histidine kinase/response regulator [bacterium]|nr:hybrid sensor histidine kinase/response regulator [bacterium]
MSTTNLIQQYFSNSQSHRMEQIIAQIDCLAELALEISEADYVAFFYRPSANRSLTPVAFSAASQYAALNPETIDDNWVDSPDLLRQSGHKSAGDGQKTFASRNQFGDSLILPIDEGEVVNGAIAFFWKENSGRNQIRNSHAIELLSRAFEAPMKSIGEVHSFTDHSKRLSGLIDLFSLPIENYRFKDFVSELTRRTAAIIKVEGLCLLKQDVRSGRLQLQEVVTRQKPKKEFLSALPKLLQRDQETPEHACGHRTQIRDISAEFETDYGAVMAIEIAPDKFYRYELVAWDSAAKELSRNDRELLSVFGVLGGAIIRNAILFRQAKKARRIMERNSSLMADMETTAALADMTSGVAHEFNNIIGGVLGRLQLIKMKHEDEKLLAQMDQIEKMILEGAATIRSIQEYTVGAEYKSLGPVNLGEVVRDAVVGSDSSWVSDAESRGISVQTNLVVSDAVVHGNADDIGTAVDKLVHNAVEFSPDNARIMISLVRAENSVKLTIADSGPGIPRANKQKIFYPFFSTKNSRLCGLGLSVVHGIATRHKAKISVKDNNPTGTIFELRFSEINAVADYSDITSQTKKVEALRILIVDDDEQIREVLRDMLSMKGHIPTACADGYAALEALEKQKFDLVITDLGMPGISGIDLARQAHESQPELPIAMITGWGSQLNKSEVTENGIKAVISKPFHLQDIQVLIEELV